MWWSKKILESKRKERIWWGRTANIKLSKRKNNKFENSKRKLVKFLLSLWSQLSIRSRILNKSKNKKGVDDD